VREVVDLWDRTIGENPFSDLEMPVRIRVVQQSWLLNKEREYCDTDQQRP
jgi:hypothetical protein